MSLIHRGTRLLGCAGLVLLAVLLSQAGHLPGVSAASPYLDAWSLDAAPSRVAVVSDTELWYLASTGTSVHRVVTGNPPIETVFDIPGAGATDLAYADGYLWITAADRNAILALDPSDGTQTSFPIPTAGANCTALDVIGGTPTNIWFTERNADVIGKLQVDTADMTYEFVEYPLGVSGVAPYDIAVTGSRVWFTAPGMSKIAQLLPASGSVYYQPTGNGTAPWAITIMDGQPWFTDAGSRSIGVYLVNTGSNLRWFDVSLGETPALDIVAQDDLVWTVHPEADMVVQTPLASPLDQLSIRLDGAWPQSLDESPQGTVFIGGNYDSQMYAWRAPYVDPSPTPTASPTNVPVGDQRVTVPLIMQSAAVTYQESLFGIQTYGTFDEGTVALDQFQASRAEWVRTELLWFNAEPEYYVEPQYNWYTDASLANMDQLGLQPIVTVKSVPLWAAWHTDDGYLLNAPFWLDDPDEADLERFAAFMGAAAERYDGDGVDDAPGSPVVNYWELFNEPDLAMYESGLYDPLTGNQGRAYWGDYGAEYAHMLSYVYPAIKAANPSAQVVLGGLGYEDFIEELGTFDDPVDPESGRYGRFRKAFLPDILTAGGGAWLDVLNFHYYPQFANSWIEYGSNGFQGKANALRAVLAEHGLSLPVICTEVGANSVPDYNQRSWNDYYRPSPENQAANVVRLLARGLSADLETIIWWTWQDAPDAGIWYYGLVSETQSAKLALDAFGGAVLRYDARTYLQSLTVLEDAEGYRFRDQNSGHCMYVLWSRSEDSVEVSLDASSAVVYDMYGDVTSAVKDADDGVLDGIIKLSVGMYPVYVECGS